MAAIHYDKYINEKTDRMVIERIMISVYGKLNQMTQLKSEGRKEIVACIKENIRIFNVAPSLKYRLFVIIMYLIGCNNALRLLCVIH